MSRKRILVIEDDTAIRRGIVDVVTFEGFDTFEAGDIAVGMAIATDAAYDLLLLDLVLPDGSGLEIMNAVREHRPTLPVIILTALGEEQDRVRGLKSGADDYIVKPFSVKELLARVEAVLRRSPARPDDVGLLNLGDATVDFARREVVRGDGARAELSERELQLIRYLSQHRGRALSRDELLANVWRIDPQCIVETRTIDMHIKRLRAKLGDVASDPRVILTVRGKGYMVARDGERV